VPRLIRPTFLVHADLMFVFVGRMREVRPLSGVGL
jgi:hypothetical protein